MNIKKDLKKLDKNTVLCIFYHDLEYFDTIYFKDNLIYKYQNIFYSEKINLSELINYYKFKNVYSKIITKENWIILKRNQILKNFKEELSSKQDNNAKLLFKDIEKNQGKCISFSYNTNNILKDSGILLSIAGTDEDYYYIFLNNKKEIHLISCVAKYKILNNNLLDINISNIEISNLLKNKFINNNFSIDTLLYLGKYK